MSYARSLGAGMIQLILLSLGRCTITTISEHVSLNIDSISRNTKSDAITVRKAQEKMPTPSNYPSRPSFDILADMQNYVLQAPHLDHRSAKKKVSLLYSALLYRHSFGTTRLSIVTDIAASSLRSTILPRQ